MFFVYDQLPARVVFGVGALSSLGREIELLGAHKVLVLSTPGHKVQAKDIATRLGARCAGIFPLAVMHVPIEAARQAREESRRLGADCVVAIGGGSTTGLGKAIALESALPILAIPTTYAGSEMTPIYGITEAGLKKTGRDLGGTWNLPHAETHAIVLPHVAAYNLNAAPQAMARVARALALLPGTNAAQGLYDLARGLCAPIALKDIGMKKAELDRAAELATQSPYYNPRPIDRTSIRKLLDDAFQGRRPN